MKETAQQLALLEPNAKVVAPKAPRASSVALLKQASSSKCTCPATLADSELTKACSSTGDPHYKGWEYVKGRTWGKFDFMGMGTFNLATATLPGCGCQVSWQTVLAANTKYRGATSNVAVAMSVGGTSFIVRADLKLTVIDASGARTTYTKGEVAPGTAIQGPAPGIEPG